MRYHFHILKPTYSHDPLEWSQPKTLYYMVVCCSLAAAVQGMDETVVNGGQIFYTEQFGIGDSNSQRGKLAIRVSQTIKIANVLKSRLMARRSCEW